MQKPPSVEAVRPPRCPSCGLAGAPVDGRIGLHGHGFRERWLLGPLTVGAVGRETVVPIRRYRCQRCGAVLVVAPRQVRRGRQYSAVAIALALGRWAVEGVPAHQVRVEIGGFKHLGADACRDWRSLRRWARAGPEIWPSIGPVPSAPPQAMAAAVVHRLSARAPLSTGAVVADAAGGALAA